MLCAAPDTSSAYRHKESPMALTCPDCAKPIQPAWHLCPHCGQPLTMVTDLKRVLATEKPNNDREETSPGRSSRPWLLAGVLAIGILGLAILALPVMMGLAGIH
jgi:hypothetical protein